MNETMAIIFYDVSAIRTFLPIEFCAFRNNKSNMWLTYLKDNYPIKSKRYYKIFSKGY